MQYTVRGNHRQGNKGRLAAAAFLLAGSLLLTACSGAAPSGDAVTEAPTSEAATSVAAATEGAATEAAATEAAVTEGAATEGAATEAAPSEAAAAPTVARLNLNEVTGDELLAAIPNFGDRMVREFQEYRPYVSIQQFRQEIGKYVDEAQVAEYEKYVYVPIDANAADEATLQQIPGVDATAAAALVAARPYASNDAFLARLAEVAPQADAASAAAWLVAQ